MRVLALLGSSRNPGNTETLTDIVLQGIPHTKIHLAEKKITPIIDMRHHPDGFQTIDDDNHSIIDLVMESDTLIFATPVYWYGMSGTMKNWIDRWSQTLRDKKISFQSSMKQKTAYVVTVGGDNPRIKGLPLIMQFQYIFDFMGMSFGGYIIGEANTPGEIVSDKQALQAAEILNQKIRLSSSSAP